jgi:hypothetical protein
MKNLDGLVKIFVGFIYPTQHIASLSDDYVAQSPLDDTKLLLN